MPTVDLGTVIAYVAEDRVEVTFPRGYDLLVKAIKEMKGRWLGDRRCWQIMPRYARLDMDSIIGRIRDVLISLAPDGWPQVVDKFGGFACASRKYEVKVGDGGVRVTLPDGHPSHWALKQVEHAQQERQTWRLPATSITAPVIQPILARIVREDKDLFVSYVEHLDQRTIRGIVPVSPEEADALGLIVDGFAYADFAFLKVADPLIKPSPIHAWPFKVLSREDKDEGVEVRLLYLDPELAYRAVRHRQAMPPENRPVLLDLPHATEKWTYKRL